MVEKAFQAKSICNIKSGNSGDIFALCDYKQQYHLGHTKRSVYGYKFVGLSLHNFKTGQGCL